MKAPIPSNEAERLAALQSYRILDSAAEALYDDITQLAAYICQVPIATISLVDEKRQWFKSRVGLSVQETPRDVAFCAHAILQPQPLIVHDATQDQRFADSTLVTQEPNIRFYAGFPLLNAAGFALGTLCAIDRQPRQITAEQINAMLSLARQVMSLLEMRGVNDRLASALEQLKTLRGLLPICAWCKRVRDDQGYWNRLETYLQQHSEADVTHSICPECFEREAKAAREEGPETEPAA